MAWPRTLALDQVIAVADEKAKVIGAPLEKLMEPRGEVSRTTLTDRGGNGSPRENWGVHLPRGTGVEQQNQQISIPFHLCPRSKQIPLLI